MLSWNVPTAVWLYVIVLNVNVLNVNVLNVNVLSVIVPNAVLHCHFAECQSAECHCAQYFYTECQCTVHCYPQRRGPCSNTSGKVSYRVAVSSIIPQGLE
jgi:hypothetical protein